MLVAAVATVSTGACAAAPARTPRATDTIARYASALARDDPRAAWRMLSKSTQRQLPFDRFAAAWRALARERAEQRRRVRASLTTAGAIVERATVTYPDGTTVPLRRTGARWRMERAFVARSLADSPSAAARQLADGLRQRDLAAVLAILTPARRDRIQRFLDGFASSMRAHARPETITYHGPNRAEMTWDDHGIQYRVILVRDHDQWRVDDFDVEPAPVPAP